MIELETRICAGEKCNQEFRVMPKDKQIWHSVFCRETHEGMGWKTIKKRFAERATYGKKEHVAPSLPLNEEESKKLKEARNRWNGGPNAVGLAEIHARNLEKKTRQESATITTVTGKKVMKDAHNGAKKIKTEKTKIKGSVMQELKKPNDQKFTPTVSAETQPADSKHLLTVLDEEKSGSLKLLNDSAKHLMDLANSLAKPTRTAEDSGEILQRAPSQNIDMAIKCFGELRNVMKTKLDYLKFGKELMDDRK